MTLLSRKADYALLILWHLHQHSQAAAADAPSPTARSIADKFGLSRPFVANILKELNHKGYVSSQRGVKGGYALHRPAAQVTLAELLESIEEGFRLTVCSSHGSPGTPSDETCSVSHVCPMKGPIAEIHHRLMSVLRGVTLEELFGPSTTAATTFLPQLTVRETPATASA